MSRAFIVNETKLLMEKNPYVMRDCNALLSEMESLFDDMAKNNMSFCDKPDPDDAERILKTTASIQAKPYSYTNKSGENKEGINYNVYVNFQTPRDTTISFNPKVYGNKLTFGEMTLTMKEEDGSFKKNSDGEIVRIVGANAIKEKANGNDEKQVAFRAFVDKLNSLTEIEDKVLNGKAKNPNYKPYYIGRSTQEILDGKGPAMYMSADLKNWFKESVDKMIPLAEKMAEKAKADGTMLQVEKDSTKNPGEKYKADASFRISIEPRMQAVKDENGDYVKDEKDKRVMEPVRNEDGSFVYDPTIAVGSLTFSVSVEEEQAKTTWVKNEAWIGDKPSFASGVKAINEKASEDVKAFVKSMSEIMFGEQSKDRENSPLWNLAQTIREELNDKSAVLLDEGGNPVLNDNGEPKKEEYVSYQKAEGSFKPYVRIASRVDKNIEVRVFEDKNSDFIAQYVHFNGKGEKPNIITLNKKSFNEVIKSEAVKEVLAKNVPSVEKDERKSYERG